MCPCTGCPEPYGLDPFQVAKIIKSSKLHFQTHRHEYSGIAARNDDYREGKLAVQTLYRILVNLQRAYS